MHALPDHPIDARPAAALAEAGAAPSCAVASPSAPALPDARGREDKAVIGLGGSAIGVRAGGFGGRNGWSRQYRYKQRGRSVARA